MKFLGTQRFPGETKYLKMPLIARAWISNNKPFPTTVNELRLRYFDFKK
jgi:hypothetical protein